MVAANSNNTFNYILSLTLSRSLAARQHNKGGKREREIEQKRSAFIHEIEFMLGEINAICSQQ